MLSDKFTSLFINPALMEKVKESFKESHSFPFPILGMDVITSPHVPVHPKKWEFPVDPFTDYEESDESWARPIGYGREVEDKSKFIVYMFKKPDFLFNSSFPPLDFSEKIS